MASGQTDLLRQIHDLFESGCIGGLTDAELLGRFVGGRDERAFEALVRRHGPMVLRVCRGVLQDAHAAEDAFQATFLVLAHKARALQVAETLGRWLHGVALRVATKAKSQDARRRRREGKVAIANDREPGVDPDRVHVEALLHEEVDRLPESYRSPIVLCYLQGMSYAMAARQLGVSEGTVRGRLARARDRLRVRLTRRGVVAPASLLATGAARNSTAAAGVPTGLVDSVVRAATHAVAGQGTVAGTVSASVAVLTKGVLQTMFITKLRMTATALVLAIAGLTSATTFLTDRRVKAADPGAPPPAPLGGENGNQGEGKVPLVVTNDNAPGRVVLTDQESNGKAPAPQSSGQNSNGKDSAEPPLLFAAIPMPWETVVRIKVHQDKDHAIGFGSGTVIRSTPAESLILTCARTFKTDDDQGIRRQPYPHRVTVDLFDGRLHSRSHPQVKFVEQLSAEVVDYDLESNVGLLRIRPGRTLAASPIVPPGWVAQSGMSLLTVGCSEGHDATAWTTRVDKPKIRPFNDSYEAIVCTNAPKLGRSGGGLFTSTGLLVGVCNYAEPRGNRGFYATPEMIYQLLARNDLASFDPGEEPGERAPETKTRIEAAQSPGPAMSEVDLDPLIRIGEEQLKNGDRQGVRATTDRLNDQLRRRREGLQSRLEYLNVLSDRSDKLRRAADGNEPPDLVRERPESSRGPTSVPIKGEFSSSSTDQERRLRQVEETLDRLLKERKGDG